MAASLLQLCTGAPSDERGWRGVYSSLSGLAPEWRFPTWMTAAEERRCRSWESVENFP